MPLSTVCVSTVSSRPRVWSSYSNIRAKDVQGLKTMNSAEEISRYKETTDHYYSPTLSRRLLGYGYDLPEKSPPKKEKKWSIGSLFRRKKREESDTSSDEDAQKKGFLNRKRRKSDKKRKSKLVGTFDHVVIPRANQPYRNGHEEGILSDPTGGFSNYVGRALPQLPNQPSESKKVIKHSHESLNDVNNSKISLASGSADSLTKKKKVLSKVRAEARRITLKHDSSSDEDSQRSVSSSKFRSDDSLGGAQKDGSLSRRSRAARTERYLRRYSKDTDQVKDQLGLSKSDAENSALNWKVSDDSNRSLSRSPLVPPSMRVKTSYSSLSSQSPSISGLSTIPPSHGSHTKVRVSNSTSNPSYKPPLSMNEYNCSTKKLPDSYFNNQRSISCEANIHRAASTEVGPEVIHIQFPIGRQGYNKHRNLSLIDSNHVNSAYVRQPPPPPPRDPKRLVTQYYEAGRPNTYYFDSTGQIRSKSFNNSSSKSPKQARNFTSFNLRPNYRSASEDQLSYSYVPNQACPRPSSTTPETSNFVQKRLNQQSNPDDYNYLMEKKPRSRKPIFIQNTSTATKAASPTADKSGAQRALDFWRKKDKEGSNLPVDKTKVESTSPQMFTCQTHVQTRVFLPSVLQNDINTDNLVNSTDSLILNGSSRSSPFKPLSPDNNARMSPQPLPNAPNDQEDIKRKSSNLEEALDELEAIYNSLRLGDEDLLERAEQRERDAQAQKLKESKWEAYPSWNSSRGTLSDSSFNYEPFDSVDSPRRKRFSRKSQTIDRRGDDMAYRKLCKERSSTINDPQSVVSKLSYLQTSPFYGKDVVAFVPNHSKNSNEPDVTLDDVVYRNVKYANNSPRVVEPQPPFGIPIGPIALAANSDYLHAVPDDIPRPTYKSRKIPDLVKDDLAFRNLRKDSTKEPALPPVSVDDLKNNNALEAKLDLNSLKKKRAVRSLSANIGSLISKEVLERGLEKHKQNNNVDNEFKTLTDIADAMEIARQVLKDKEQKISNTRKAFLSDTDTTSAPNMNGRVSERRMNFLNTLKDDAPAGKDNLQAKPPRGLTPERRSPRSPKESTPIPISPLDDKARGYEARTEVAHSSFDDLLTALASEARETSERITKELRLFDDERKLQPINDPSSDKAGLRRQLSDIEAVSDQAKLCKKLLEEVVDSSDLVASSKAPVEEVQQITIEPPANQSVANIVMSRDGSSKMCDPIVDKASSDSEHDYENLLSDKELSLDETPPHLKKSTSPFEEHKADLIASFQELKKNIDLDIGSAAIEPTSSSSEDSTANDKVTGVL